MTIQQFLPLLQVSDALAAIDFYQRAFGAVEQYRVVGATGHIVQAELTLGPATLLLADVAAADGAQRGSATLHLTVDDCETWVQRLQTAGAQPVTPAPAPIPGRQRCLMVDPFGQRWLLEQELDAGKVEDLKLRFAQMRAQDA